MNHMDTNNKAGDFAGINPVPVHSHVGKHAAVANKKPNKVLRTCLIIFSCLFLVVIVVLIALLIWVHNLNSSMSFDDSEQMRELRGHLAESDGTKPFYMLILGSDARKGDVVSRSDVTMLVRIDPNKGIVSLVSIPRDTMINLGIYGTQKINAAYAYNGPVGAISAVSEFAGVPISHYAEVNFDSLVELVDMLGGVSVNVPESFSGGNGGISLEAGEQILTGKEALGFARERYNVSGGDFSRAQAQRIIVGAIIKKVLDTPFQDMPSVIEKAFSTISSDLSVENLVQLALKFQKSGATVYSASTPSYAYYYDGVSYVATMYDEWRDMMCRVDAGLDPNDTLSAIPEEQLNNTLLGSASNGDSPRDYKELAANASLTTDSVVKED